MGTLIKLYFDDPKLIAVARHGSTEAIALPEVPDDPELASAMRSITKGGLGSSALPPRVTIRAFRALCERYTTAIGEIDHFTFEEEHLPELSALQFGETTTPLALPVDEDLGLPAVNHWPTTDLVELWKRLTETPASARPAYCQTVYADLTCWLKTANDRHRGLLVFTE